MNIKEIASKAGVSVATVSRVLNHPENVASETRAKILSVMEESNYTPNWFARGLNFNRTNTIAMIIPNILDQGYMEIAKGIEDVAHQKDCITLFCNAEDSIDKERQYIDNLLQRRVDGIVLVSTLLEDSDIKRLKERNIPIVMIGENNKLTGIPKVHIDCEGAAYIAVTHLINAGYKKIKMVYGESPKSENEKKIAGYKRALDECDYPVNINMIIKTENDIQGGYIAGKKIIEGEDIPDAIFASSDLIAIGIIEAMKDNGTRVPDDVAVIGFDNNEMTKYIEPKLTTVEKPMHKMGVVGARLLFDIVENVEEDFFPEREIVLQSKLKVRKSCGESDRLEEMF